MAKGPPVALVPPDCEEDEPAQVTARGLAAAVAQGGVKNAGGRRPARKKASLTLPPSLDGRHRPSQAPRAPSPRQVAPLDSLPMGGMRGVRDPLALQNGEGADTGARFLDDHEAALLQILFQGRKVRKEERHLLGRPPL